MGKLKTYDAVVNGHPTRIKLTEQEAEARGLTEATKAPAKKAPVKKRTAANKAADGPETSDG